MNEASRWKLVLARRIADAYSPNPKVASVLLGGSVPRGFADRYPDLEIYVFWHKGALRRGPSLSDRARGSDAVAPVAL